MQNCDEYYVVGIYRAKNGTPVKVYKVTATMIEAVYHYFNHWDDPCCYVGFYYKNELSELYKFTGNDAEGPGIFNTSVVTLDDIKNYQNNL